MSQQNVNTITGDIMESIWSMETKLNTRKNLTNDIQVDTLVIGAGIAGILTAYLLQEQGIEAVIVDAKEICSGQTKNTSAKITSQHGIIYSKIEEYYGESYAQQYAKANEEAIAEYKRIINDNNIDCDFEEKDAVIYSKDSLDQLLAEEKAAKKAGIDCYFTNDAKTPFEAKGALVFKNQGQFNPIKFIDAISKDLTIYENTKATKIIGNTVFTPHAKIHAKNIVIACHYPFINYPSLYFLRISSERSYVIALKNTGYNTDSMYIGVDTDSISIRQYQDYLLLGGGAHRTGSNSQTDIFEQLSSRANRLFPNCKIVAKGSAQDCITLDHIPYIGRFSDNDNIYIATGFNKWGMTSSMVSAKIINSMICNKNCSYSDVFSPRRFNIPASSEQIIKNTKETVKGFASHLKLTFKTAKDIAPNTAAEIMHNGKIRGAYKDENENIFIVSLTCPHLKCKLKWNNTTRTWDCPCHGSRYSYLGELIDNPAQSNSILVDIIQK